MATVTSAMVKELRERTNAGMMDCKKALVNNDGDMDKAIDWLREKGLAQAAKKASRIAAEGVVTQYITPCGCTGVVVEVNCETDFVAKTDNFVNFANNVARHIAMANPADVDELMNQKFVDDESKTISDLVSEATVAIGEKISVRRFQRIETDGVVSAYIHMGGKVGVLVEVATDETGRNSDAVKDFAHDLALQIAAAKPEAVRREEVDTEKLEKEKEDINKAIGEVESKLKACKAKREDYARKGIEELLERASHEQELKLSLDSLQKKKEVLTREHNDLNAKYLALEERLRAAFREHENLANEGRTAA